ncbi:MAG: D-alanine--D-alanine ligase family protein [Rudaea sp.]
MKAGTRCRHSRSGQTVLILEEHESVWSEEARAEVRACVAKVQAGLEGRGYRAICLQVKSPEALPELLAPYDPGTCIVFNWYEGVERSGRDCIQVAAQLDRLGYLYTGADAATLRRTQDKVGTAALLQSSGVPTPVCVRISEDKLPRWERYPAIVKLANEHGSECLTDESVVCDEQGLRRCVGELGAPADRPLMISEFIAGREFTISLWGNGHLEVLPIVEMDYSRLSPGLPHLRTYDAKWDPEAEAYRSIKLVSPPSAPAALLTRIVDVAQSAYSACELRDYGRVDIRLHDEEPRVIDVNANPDLAADSSFTLAAARAGMDSTAMVERIIRLALRRGERAHEERLGG